MKTCLPPAPTNTFSSYLISLYLIFLAISAVYEQYFSFLQLYALFTAAYWGNTHEKRGRSICVRKKETRTFL